jgi:3-methylfumaryl-CoA hydratase
MQEGLFQDWIGRTSERTDIVTSRVVEQFRATLAPHLFDVECPPGLHWCLAVANHGNEKLGPDGAELKGLFIPPIDLPRRMWAGGAIETFGAFRAGDEVLRRSRIADVKWRNGKTGPLCIVVVTHDFVVREMVVLRERQDLLFRDGPLGTTAPERAAHGQLVWEIEASPLLLFRFSALTFNGHRIHYDLPFARESEGYDGLLVHGPLQATLMFNQFSAALGHVPRRFEYRCVAPLISGQRFLVSCTGGQGRIEDAKGVLTLEAKAK